MIIAFDTETHLIKPGLAAPRMVCLSYAMRPPDKALSMGLQSRDRGLFMVTEWLQDDEVTLVGHNVWYDLGVIAAERPALLPLIFDKIDKGLIRCTQLRQELIDVAEGNLKFYIDEETGEVNKSRYGLADLSLRLNKRFIAKKGSDIWRLRYALLDGVPVEQWPDSASNYAIQDAEVALEVHETQERTIAEATWARGVLPNQVEQHRAAWALHLMSMWGVRTDGVAVERLRAELEKEHDEQMFKLRPTGLFNIAPARVNRKGVVVPEKVSKNMKEIYARVMKCYRDKGEVCPTTPTGKAATDKKTLENSGDPDLALLAQAGATSKLLGTYVPILERGVFCPICARYNPLMETGRTSCSGPNLQNPPRKGGVRECFIPRRGWVYVFCDYDTLELRALAQVCLDVLGESSMAEALRRGEDLHLALAAEMLGISIEQAKERLAAGDEKVKEYRQQAKPANFGFPGGMAAKSFKEYAEGYKIFLTTRQCEDLYDSWNRKWSEMVKYFEFISNLVDRYDQIKQVRSGRVRGGATFTMAANGFFQGLASDGAKEALWNVARECYLADPHGEGPTALYGCRPVLFLHDEIGIEAPYNDPVKTSQAADRLAAVMISSMEKWITDVPITAKPIMCRRWYKGAEPVRVNGRLVPSRPVKEGEKTKWVADVEEVAVAA